MFNNVDIAQRIKEKCKENNIAISILIENCSLSKGFIYELEKRNKSLSTDRIFKIAKYLNCSIDYLLGLENEPNKQLTENQKEILKLFNKLTEDYQKKAISKTFDLLVEMAREQDKG